jgi:hypothetical protein
MLGMCELFLHKSYIPSSRYTEAQIHRFIIQLHVLNKGEPGTVTNVWS